MPITEKTPLLGDSEKRKIEEVLNNTTENNIKSLSPALSIAALQIAISKENINAIQALLKAGVQYHTTAEIIKAVFEAKPQISKNNEIYQKLKENKREIISVICPYLQKHDLEVLKGVAERQGHTEITTLLAEQIEELKAQKVPGKRCVIM